MKKFRLLTLTLVVLMAFSALSFSAFAEGETTTTTTTTNSTSTDPSESTKPSEPTDPTDPTTPTDPSDVKTSGDWKYKVLTEKTIEIVGYTGTATECVIPSKLDEKAVTSIASGIVKNNSNIFSVVIPASVTSLQPDSFMGCMALKKITLANGGIKKFDIEYCPSLEEINLPASVTSIGMLEQCTMLQKINVDVKNTALKSVDGVVYSADNKTLVKYPAGKIVTRFTIPATVISVADYAFAGTASNIKELFVPVSVQKMGANAFTGSMVGVLFQADKAPAGCEAAVKGMNVKYNQINVFAPKKMASDQNSTAIKIAWEKVVGADGYKVYYKTAKGWKDLGNTTKTSVTFSKLKPGTRYTFAVKSLVLTAGNKIAQSADYITHEASTAPVATTKILSAKNDSAIKIAWEKVKGADGYAIYHKTASGWKLVKTLVGNSVTFSKLDPYTNYTLAVRTLIKTADKIVQGGYKQITVRTNIETPKTTAKQTAAKEVKLTWTPSVGASHYQVFYKINDSQWYLLSTQKDVKILSFSNTQLKAGMKITLATRSARVENGKVVATSAYVPVDVILK